MGFSEQIKNEAISDPKKFSEITANIEDAKERIAERVVAKLTELQLREQLAEARWKVDRRSISRSHGSLYIYTLL